MIEESLDCGSKTLFTGICRKLVGRIKRLDPIYSGFVMYAAVLRLERLISSL